MSRRRASTGSRRRRPAPAGPAGRCRVRRRRAGRAAGCRGSRTRRPSGSACPYLRGHPRRRMRYGRGLRAGGALPRALVKRECRWATVIFARADDPEWRQPGDDRARPRAARLQRLAASRRPGVAMVSGEPGVGKTRLIQEFLATLGADTVVLVGQAEPGSLSRPYEVLMDALDGRDDVDPEQLAAIADASRSPVERLHAGVRLVGDLVGDRPAVLVFEDLHWADSESAALFERLADLDGPRVLVGTYRRGRGHRPRPGRRAAGPARPAPRGDPHRPRALRRGRHGRAARRAHRPSGAACGRWPRCTSAPAATRSSSRSCCAATRAKTSSRSTSRRCRGASPRCCAARSTTSSPDDAPHRRDRGRARPPGALRPPRRGHRRRARTR